VLTEGRGGAALTFWGNQTTVSAFVVLAASSPTPKRRVCLRLEGCLIPLGSPLFFWEQLGGLPRLWFGRFTIQGSGCKRTTLSGCLLLFGSPLFLPKPNDG
jgi:hypothetical protein